MKGEVKDNQRGTNNNHSTDVYPGAQQHRRGQANKRLVLDFILSYIASHQYAPTIREIQEALGFGSPSTVLVHLKELEVEGVLKRNVGKPRGIDVVENRNSVRKD